MSESLQVGAVIDAALSVHQVSRAAAGDTEAGQPAEWTFIEFSVEAGQTEALAAELSRALLPDGGWYCNFNSDDEVVVAFHGRVFRYRAGDREARAEVEQYARDLGVPDSQLDWTEPT